MEVSKMTQLELMIHAQNYIKSLANGFNPLDNSRLPENDIVNDIRISRCLFYVSAVLQEVINNDGRVSSKSKQKKLPFTITPQQLHKIKISKVPISLSDFIKNINSVIDTENYKRLTYKELSGWLVAKGLLSVENIDGKNKKVITDKSNQAGISVAYRRYYEKTYTAIVYDQNAQKYILDNILDILKYLENTNN
jgi:hypothetical protein